MTPEQLTFFRQVLGREPVKWEIEVAEKVFASPKPITIIEPWPGFRVDIAEREHEQMMAAIRADALYGVPFVLDERACHRLSIADNEKPHSPVWCKSTPMMLSFRGDRVWLFRQHGDQRRRYRRRTAWRTL